MALRRPKIPRIAPTSTDADLLCITYCASFYDYEECKKVCLTTSGKNLSLFRRALKQAEDDGLNETHQHIFAAGAVWAWSESRKLPKLA